LTQIIECSHAPCYLGSIGRQADRRVSSAFYSPRGQCNHSPTSSARPGSGIDLDKEAQVASFDPDALLTPNAHLLLASWEHRSASTQKGVECVLQPGGALKTLPELGITSWVLSRSRSGTKGGRQGSIDPYSHLLPDILGASIAKLPEECRARSSARGGPENTLWSRQRVLGPASIPIRKYRWPLLT
jgi:hypothetical protein